ncbi:MAG: V-type ATP synthase subunit F [Bacillota bacterium]|nr:V-type ATP synthase subunit F [Bacillota bacterium]
MADKLLKMGAVGESDAIQAFRAIGAVAVPATTPDEVTQALHRLAREGTPVIFITESAARMAPEAISRYEQTMETAVIPIPGIKGSDGYGEQKVRESVIKAIGADILNQNN